jgi:hypothetical protein
MLVCIAVAAALIATGVYRGALIVTLVGVMFAMFLDGHYRRRSGRFHGGTVEGRRTRMEEVEEPALAGSGTIVTATKLSVAAKNLPDLSITRTVLGNLKERGTPRAERGTPRAERALGRDKELRGALEALFDVRGGILWTRVVSKLESKGSALVATAVPGIGKQQELAILDALSKIASALERTEIAVRALGATHQALTEGGHLRCSYCHDAVTGDEADLVACKQCSTVLHEGCFAENGRCPILGCSGSFQDRVRSLA